MIVDSGRLKRVGEEEEAEGGRLRPRRPSGDDWRELLVRGLAVAVEAVPVGVVAVAGVSVKGTEVMICCLGLGDCQHFPLPSEALVLGVMAVGAMLPKRLER